MSLATLGTAGGAPCSDPGPPGAAVWVHFTDRGIGGGENALESAIRAAGASVTPRARARRERETGGRFMPDAQDLAVPTAYLDGVRSAGARIRHASRWLNAVSVEADETALARIASLPYVRGVTPVASLSGATGLEIAAAMPGRGGVFAARDADARYGGFRRAPAAPLLRRGAMLDPPSSYGASDVQLLGVNAIAAHDSGYSGAGVLVGVFDTGFWKENSALAPLQRIAEWDFDDNDGETGNEPGDNIYQWNHGTGTWSIIGGYWPGELIGPAYNASFLLAKTRDIDLSEPSEEDQWLAAMEWADSIGVDVISSAMVVRFYPSAPSYDDEHMDGQTAVITQAALTAARRGIVVACAMGNTDNPPVPTSLWAPADADSILSVGAVYDDGTIWEGSTRGPTYDGRGKPDVVAQGYGVIWAITAWDGTGSYPGTSTAVPLVGGVAALVREAHPEWTAQQIRYAIKSTASRAGTPDSTTYGWGRPNAIKAIYQSTLGPPVFPKPFGLTSPADSATVSAMPVTFRWRTAADPTPGDAVTYAIELRDLDLHSTIWSTTTSDTFATYTGPLAASTLHEWRVTATDLLGHGRPSREPYRFISGAVTAAPLPGRGASAPRVVLRQNRPNPLQGTTEIGFEIFPAESRDGALGAAAIPVALRVFDARGQLVRTLLEGDVVPPHAATVRWDGRDASGRPVSDGLYVYRLRVGRIDYSRRLLLLK